MKTAKKIISLVIAFAMVMSITAFAGFKDVDSDADYADAVELLSTLDIIQGDEYGNFNPNDTITRAEMAAIICRAKGLEGSARASAGATAYYDVPANHWASGYINLATHNGIINGHGDGSFAPEDDVTYEEAIKMIMCALGYEPMAKAKGGFPTGYLIVANTYDVTDGVTATYRAPRKTVSKLLYNALSTPMMDQTTWGSTADYQVLDGKHGRDYKTLLTDMDIYIATGIVGEKTYDEVEFDIKEDSDDLEFEKGDVETFKINGSDIENYQHQNVNVYVHKASKRKYEIVAVVSGIEGTTLTIISDDVESYSNNKVSYYIDSANSSKTKTFKLKSAPSVEYNHSEYDGSISSLLLEEEDVELKFIENTGDSIYDVIVATKYHCARVGYVAPEKDRIEIGSTTVTLDFDDFDTTIILRDDRGRELDLYDFDEDDVVAVVADSKNFKNYNNYIEIIKLNNAVVRGSVEATYSYGNSRYLVIDDEEYIDATGGSGLSVGDEGVFFIGMTGKIIDFDGSSASKDYAYILEAALSKTTFSSDKWVIKLLTSDNRIVTYQLTDDASDYFENTYAALIGINPATQSKQLYKNLTAAQKADPDRLITYKTNARGYIKSIKSAKDTAAAIKTLSASTDDYNANTQKVNGAILEDNVVIFNLSGSSADKAYATDIDYLVHKSKYSGFVYANQDYEYCVMVITDGESEFEAESGFAIATRVATIDDSEGNPVTKVTFIQNEESSVVYFNEDSENKAGSDSAYESLEVGDVFAYNASSSGYVSEYTILGKINSKGLLTANTAAYDKFNDDTEFIYGYISNTFSEKRNTSKGEVITVKAGKSEESLLISSYTNRYTYNDAGRNVIIEIGDYLAQDAYYYDDETGEVTYVFIKLVDDSVVDIYSFNTRVNISGAISVEKLINDIGTVEYTPSCLNKIEDAEEAYGNLTSSEKSIVSNYSVLTQARAKYDELKAKAKAEQDAEAAKGVVDLIDAIGTVEYTADSKAKIDAAKQAYDALDADKKAYVTNSNALEVAVAAYAELEDKAKAAKVDEMISAITTIDATEETKSKIEAAENAYDALNADQKKYVTKHNLLADARAAYDALVTP